MVPFDIAQTFIELCQLVDDPNELAADFGQSIQQLGFQYYACSHVNLLDSPASAVMLQSDPTAWIRDFSENGRYKIDSDTSHHDSSICREGAT
jgi:hypothetical protein